MTEPSVPDPLHTWTKALDQLLRAAGAGADPSGLSGKLLEPLQQQRDFLVMLARQQTEWQEELVERLVAPMESVEELISESAVAMREQADALGQAARALAKVSATLNAQAARFETGSQALKSRAETTRSLARLASRATEATFGGTGTPPV